MGPVKLRPVSGPLSKVAPQAGPRAGEGLF